MVQLEISTHSGSADIVEVETYDAGDLVEKMNDNEVYAIKIAENIYSRIDLKNIKVLEKNDK